MDLHIADIAANPDENDALDRVLGATDTSESWRRESGGAHSAAQRRPLLLTALHALVDRVGYVSEGGLAEVCRRLDVPPADAYGVATFYSMIPVTPVPPVTTYVCEDIACMIGTGGTTASQDNGGQIVRAPCLGLCEQAPAALTIRSGATVQHTIHSTPPERGSLPQQGDSRLVLTRRIGSIDPTSLDDYLATDGYTALRHALRIGPTGVIDEVMASGLVGRGGAAFPTGRKWAAVAAQPTGQKYVVANADESEPGTFKDRVLMEGDPFALIEAMTIAGIAVGASQGYIYLRDEYRHANELLARAVSAARAAQFLGTSILGTEHHFDVQIVRGAGAYICGEETAIFNSIEGYRGEPRSKPPFPTEVGLFGKPTLVNNVETLVNVLPIVQHGGATFAATGVGSSTGTKLFCLSGAVRHPGVYEVPFGTTLRALIDLAGGVTGSGTLRAVLLGGAAGSFVSGGQIDLPLTVEATRSAGATLGSGVVFVIDDATPIEPILARLTAFFRHESCGQCVPCRVGTVRQDEIVTRLAIGRRRPDDLALLRDVGQVMRDASICGLGQTAWNAVESAIDRLGVFQ